MEILNINILVQVLTLVGMFKVASFGNSANVTKFIESQTGLCSYVSLCTSKKTSVYIKRYKEISVPCCHECFCDEKCQARGDCCPDFNSFRNNKTSPHTVLESLPNNTGSTKNSYTGLSCVRSHHGLFKNNEGYEMVASCPRNFTENATKIRCETTFDILNANIYDHIPVSDTVSGLTFKNRFCKSCHFNNGGPLEFWEVWLACDGNFYFSYFDLTNPFDLVEKIFKSKERICSIVFKPIDTSPQQCVVIREKVTDTCSDGSWDADLQNACKEYTWLIMAMDGLALDSYKNHACMLCNGVTFEENCRTTDYQSVKHFTASLNIEMYDNQTNETLSEYPIDSNDFKVTSQYQHIQIIFTSPDGICSKGFVYDKRNSTCRPVLCPQFFYIKDGSCAPIFRVIKGVFYRVILEILLPYSLNGAEAELVEMAMFSSLDDIFRHRVGKGNYKFSLWRNSISAKAISRKVTYALYLTVKGQFAKGSYLAFLNFMNQLVLFERQFPVSVLVKDSSVNVNVGLKFGTSVVMYTLSVLKYLRNFGTLDLEDMHLVLPPIWKESFDQTSTVLDVTKLSFCHTITLSQLEFRRLSHFLIEVLQSKRILHQRHYRIMSMLGKYRASVCMNDVFLDVDESSGYVLNVTDSLLLMYQWPANTGHEIRTETDDTKGQATNILELASSVVVIIFLFAFLGLLVFIKTALKEYAESFPASIPMSDIRTISEITVGEQNDETESVQDNTSGIAELF